MGGETPVSDTEVREIAAVFERSGHVAERFALGEGERKLLRLDGTGALRRFSHIHFACNATASGSAPFLSALHLSDAAELGPVEGLLAGEGPMDGLLTAAEILALSLRADLVVLSACRTGGGPFAPGEGELGFAQALLAAGARSAIVSLWTADDVATAILMARLYENLLGARAGLRGPLPVSEALREAQAWLRDLPSGEVEVLAARALGKRMVALMDEEERPYAHPYYWAPWVVVGDGG